MTDWGTHFDQTSNLTSFYHIVANHFITSGEFKTYIFFKLTLKQNCSKHCKIYFCSLQLFYLMSLSNPITCHIFITYFLINLLTTIHLSKKKRIQILKICVLLLETFLNMARSYIPSSLT
jgi:hypothetical protein